MGAQAQQSVAAPDGQPVPGIAPAAKQQGRYVAATIGKRKAVIDFGPDSVIWALNG
ncbi:hypothetical protein [Sphingomonas koreensis]